MEYGSLDCRGRQKGFKIKQGSNCNTDNLSSKHPQLFRLINDSQERCHTNLKENSLVCTDTICADEHSCEDYYKTGTSSVSLIISCQEAS